MVDFYRRDAATYFAFAGLPTHKPLNPGGAPVAPQKTTGPSANTYYVAFGETANSANANRAHDVLALNTDLLDNWFHRNLAVPVVLEGQITSGSTTSIAITGDVYVGEPGTTDDEYNLQRLVKILDINGNPLIFESTPVSHSVARIYKIHDGSGNSVVGDPSSGPSPPGDLDGFYTDPTIDLTVSVPDSTYYTLVYYVREALASQPVDVFPETNHDFVWTHLETLFNRSNVASVSNWKDGTTNPSTTAANQVKKIITDLVADAGSDRIGSNAYAGTELSLTDSVSIYDQLKEIVDYLDNLISTDVGFASAKSRTSVFHAREVIVPRQDPATGIPDYKWTGAAGAPLVSNNSSPIAFMGFNAQFPKGATIKYVEFLLEGSATGTFTATMYKIDDVDWSTPDHGTESTVATNALATSGGDEVLRLPSSGDFTPAPLMNNDDLFWIRLLYDEDATGYIYAVRVHWEQPSVSYI